MILSFHFNLFVPFSILLYSFIYLNSRWIWLLVKPLLYKDKMASAPTEAPLRRIIWRWCGRLLIYWYSLNLLNVKMITIIQIVLFHVSSFLDSISRMEVRMEQKLQWVTHAGPQGEHSIRSYICEHEFQMMFPGEHLCRALCRMRNGQAGPEERTGQSQSRRGVELFHPQVTSNMLSMKMTIMS